MAFDFPTTPSGTVAELWRAVLRLLPQVAGRTTVNRGVTIGTTETPVAHGLKSTPVGATLIPQADCRWWQTKSPDASFAYFAASTAVTADVVFFA